MSRPSSRYALELAEQQSRRSIAPRERDDSPGFAGQAAWGSASVQSAPVSPDENPEDDGPSQHQLAVWKLAYQITSGTAPAHLCDRALKCAVSCAKATGKPVAQFLDQSSVSVAEDVIQRMREESA